ncbi:MAG: capsular biosynthesis protein [Verrucomicrobia bacterium]|nr:capsular biosynthesis protein [Verrucomicrobiota bacterium]
MRICIDLDGVIAEFKKDGQSYGDVAPVPGAREHIKALKAAGHTIIILTARHMKTCSGNQGLVMARVGLTTIEWLENHDIPYDELHFGKPWAHVYIDDNAYRFESWDKIGKDATGLPENREKVRQQQNQ